MPKRLQTPKEELTNALSHGIGLIMGLIGIPFLIQKALEIAKSSTQVGAIAFSSLGK